MPIGNAVALAVADQATMEGIWDDPDNRVLQSSIYVTAVMTGDGLDFVPMLMLKEAPLMTPATVTSKMSREFFPKPSPVNRGGQLGVFPRRQATDPVEGNCICCRFWRRHIALFPKSSTVDSAARCALNIPPAGATSHRRNDGCIRLHPTRLLHQESRRGRHMPSRTPSIRVTTP